jgi:hypothetical protein
MTKDEALKLALERAANYIDALGGDSRKYRQALAEHVFTALRDRLAQPEQEPVAYLCENAVGHKYFRWKKPSSTYKPIALYTTPPQRTWTKLTDEEVGDLSDFAYTNVEECVRNVEAKLKEKNT